MFGAGRGYQRYAFVFLGPVLLLALAAVVLVAPGLLGPLGPSLQRVFEATLPNAGLVLAVLGIATAIAGAIVAKSSTPTAVERPDLDAVLGGVDSTVAGSALDERLRRLAESGAGDERADLRSEVHDVVEETAVTVLSRTGEATPAEVRTRLENGSWTTNSQAAAFFSRDPAPLAVRAREWLDSRSSDEQRLAGVLTELEARMGLESPVFPAGSRTARRTGSGDPATHSIRDELENAVRHKVSLDSTARPSEDRVVESVRLAAESDARSVDERSTVVTPRQFGLAVGLVAVTIGLLTRVTAPFLLGLLALGYSLTKYVAAPPVPRLELTRTVASDSPVPGDIVEVELAVENIGDGSLPDLRIVDGVPEALRVVEGSPSTATSLPPGETATLQYAIRAKRGTFTFADIQLRARDIRNVQERALEVTVPTRLTGATRLDRFALEPQDSQRIGSVKTNRGGSGVEFYGTREYREGDPLGRVDWNHLAKTGALTTVEFREQRAPTVAIVLDQRDASRVAPTGAALDGVDLSVYAADQVFETLAETGTEVGLITYGERLTDVEPASDATQRALVQSRLLAATDRYAAALTERSVDSGGVVYQRLSPTTDMIGQHVPRNAQVLVLSPGTDAFAVEVTERLSALGHPVTLLSPAVAAADSVGSRHRRVDRACRLQAVRDHGTRVIDWEPDEPLQLAIARAMETIRDGT